MSKSFKKYKLKYEYLKLELEDTLTQAEEYRTSWLDEFGKYFKEDKEKNTTVSSETKPKVDVPVPLKKLYRKLSTHLHPDKGGDPDKFDSLKKLQDNLDYVGMIILAEETVPGFTLPELEEELLENSYKYITDQIESKTKSVMWNYFKGDESVKKETIEYLEKTYNIEINNVN